jgi:hypothetical protein
MCSPTLFSTIGLARVSTFQFRFSKPRAVIRLSAGLGAGPVLRLRREPGYSPNPQLVRFISGRQQLSSAVT